MKIYKTKTIRAWDQYTIDHEPISSIDLMERAARVFTHQFINDHPDLNQAIIIFCGKGNNGGDGMVVGRLLANAGYQVTINYISFKNKSSEAFIQNLKVLPKRQGILLNEIKKLDDLTPIVGDCIVIDALFGIGLSRPLNEKWNAVISYINQQRNLIVSIDMPSGLSADLCLENEIIRSNQCFTFQVPKLSMLLDENQKYTGTWKILDIGLDKNFIQKNNSPLHFIDYEMIRNRVQERKVTDHKGSFGHALIVAGSVGKIGAAVLAAESCLRSGVGLVTTHIPQIGMIPFHTRRPEIMLDLDEDESIISAFQANNHSAIGIGCGIGQDHKTVMALSKFLKKQMDPIVLDADALNILAEQRDLLEYLPKGSILTPHPLEYARLFGHINDPIKRLEHQIKQSKKHQIYILYKGHYSRITSPEGQVYFNSTGNVGMATAGSGDVLMGMITGLLAQGYSAQNASILGMYLHGLAGDIAADIRGLHALIASDIIDAIGSAYQTITK